LEILAIHGSLVTGRFRGASTNRGNHLFLAGASLLHLLAGMTAGFDGNFIHSQEYLKSFRRNYNRTPQPYPDDAEDFALVHRETDIPQSPQFLASEAIAIAVIFLADAKHRVRRQAPRSLANQGFRPREKAPAVRPRAASWAQRVGALATGRRPGRGGLPCEVPEGGA